MQPVMDVAGVKEFESALAEKGLGAPELMRRAGEVVALQAARLVRSGSVVVMCGMGNNGGDGWVAADALARHGYEVSVVSAAIPAVIKTETARGMAARAVEMGVPVHVDPSPTELAELLGPADVVVDAVFGTGFSGAMPSPYDSWVRAVDDGFAGSVVSVDVPSGVSATTGMAEGPHFQADVTVTMFACKPGLISGVGRAACGEVVVASLASDEEGLADLSDAAAAFMLEDADYDGALPEPGPLDDKYSRGRVLVVAGSARYPGAAVMAAVSAARAGAGYVTLAVPEPAVACAQAHLLSVPVVGLPADADGSLAAEAADRAAALAAKADAVLAGPGLTTSFGACETVRRLLAEPCALVLDADALNALVKICTGSVTERPAPLRRERPLVLTPHRGELARLAGKDRAEASSLAQAMRMAQEMAWAVGSKDFCVVAKGPMTCVSSVDGTVIPEAGPSCLATAGTGDVLAGVVVGVLAQALARRGPDEPVGPSGLMMLAAAADRAHAIAGGLAQAERGSRGVVAPDVADKVGLALDELERAARAAAALGEGDEGGRLEGALKFEEESRIAPPPEVERLIRSDADARSAKLPGELKGYEGDLEEPDEGRGPGEEPLLEPPVAASAEPASGRAPAAPEPAARPAVPPFLAGMGAAPPAPPAPEAEAAPAGPAAAPASEPDGAAGAAEPQAQAQVQAQPVPPFLARAGLGAVLPGTGRADGAGAEAGGGSKAQLEDAPEGEPEEPEEAPLTVEEMERRRREVFHERATLRVEDDSVTPVDSRPSAKPRRRR